MFNLNAPVPPATDGQADPMKQSSQFPGGYGQGFTSQSESTVDQPDIPQETLQSGEGWATDGLFDVWKKNQDVKIVWHHSYIDLAL